MNVTDMFKAGGIGIAVAFLIAMVPEPPQQSISCSAVPIRILVEQGHDAKGNPTMVPVVALDTPICACSDGIVRRCQ